MDLFVLFGIAFGAATILPLGSEPALVAVLLSGASVVPALLAATAGNVLGSLVNYGLGRWLGPVVAQRFLRMTDAKRVAAQARFERLGRWSLLLAWVPVIGDPLTVVAGLVRVPLGWFLVLVTVGKGLRYCVVAGVALGW